MMYGTEFKDNLKMKRKVKEFTVAQLSAKSGISTYRLEDFENGRKLPKITELEQLARPLECPSSELVSKEEYELSIIQEHSNYEFDQSFITESALIEIPPLPRKKSYELITLSRIEMTNYVKKCVSKGEKPSAKTLWECREKVFR